MRLNWPGDSHTFQMIHKEKLSSLQGGLLTLMLGIIAERPKNRDGLEEDGSCAFSSIDISIVGNGLQIKERETGRGRTEPIMLRSKDQSW